jgi:hypothetical protein
MASGSSQCGHSPPGPVRRHHSARSADDADLLGIVDDEAAQALNGRSELIVHRLFVPSTPTTSTIAATTTAV